MASRRTKNAVKRAVTKQVKKSPIFAVFLAIVILAVVVGGYFYYNKYIKNQPVTGDLTFHFMTLGNGHSGDSIYIKAGDNDILIDAGSDFDSVSAIKDYLDDYVTDGTLEYVIATHGDKDHIAGFANDDGNIFDYYKCGIIIDFPLTSKKLTTDGGAISLYGRYVRNRDNEVTNDRATHYTALECYNNQNGAKREYVLDSENDIKMEILYNYYYDHLRDTSGTEENDYSVCVQFSHGTKKFLFTGDLEKKGEEYLVEYNDLSQVELYKAGHHGSASSSTERLIDIIMPKICVVTCAIGDKYDFPRQEFINNVGKWTTKVYVTTMADERYTNGKEFTEFNGNVVVVSDSTGVSVKCQNDFLLKDSDWFKQYRTAPNSSWAS